MSLTPLTSLTSLTSELAKAEYMIESSGTLVFLSYIFRIIICFDVPLQVIWNRHHQYRHYCSNVRSCK